MPNTTPLTTAHPPSSVGDLHRSRPPARPLGSKSPTVGDVLSEDLVVVGATPYGLPSVMLLAGWVLFALALVGPFMVLVVVGLAALTIVAIAVAIAGPAYLLFLLVRHVRRSAAKRTSRLPLWRRHRERDAVGVSSPRPQMDIQTQAQLTSEQI